MTSVDLAGKLFKFNAAHNSSIFERGVKLEDGEFDVISMNFHTLNNKDLSKLSPTMEKVNKDLGKGIFYVSESTQEVKVNAGHSHMTIQIGSVIVILINKSTEEIIYGDGLIEGNEFNDELHKECQDAYLDNLNEMKSLQKKYKNGEVL